jgi:hypothetical protein
MINDIPESSHQGNKKSKGKPFCYRCHTKGHTMAVCTTPLCCEICFGEHVTKTCPNIKKNADYCYSMWICSRRLGFLFYSSR